MKNTVAKFIADNFYWVLIAVLALNLFQRKHGRKARKKRSATLYIAIGVFLLYSYSIMVVELKLSDPFLLIFAAAAAVAVYFLRDKIFPFRFKCVSCKTPLSTNEIVFDDSNLCANCKERMEAASEKEAIPAQDTPADEEDESEGPGSAGGDDPTS